MSISVTLSVLSSVLRPEEITRVVKFRPDNYVLKGNEQIPPRPIPKFFGWYVKFRDNEEKDVSTVLNFLMDRLSEVENNFSKLKEFDPEIEIRFSIAINEELSRISFFIEPNLIHKIAQLKGSISLEVF